MPHWQTLTLRRTLNPMSDQLFWIFAVLLVVEIMSQLFQFESMGKIFVQFYVLIVHALIGVTLATFETRDLIYYFVVLIAFVNSLRFLLYKIPTVQDSGVVRFSVDVFTLIALFGLMWGIDPYLSFTDVPDYSEITQYSVLAGLGLALLFEMIQRANGTGINIDDFLPRSFISFLTVSLVLGAGIGLMTGFWWGLPTALKFQIMVGYILFILMVKGLSLSVARDPEFYDLLYVMPSLVSLVLFAQLIIFGG